MTCFMIVRYYIEQSVLWLTSLKMPFAHQYNLKHSLDLGTVTRGNVFLLELTSVK